MKMIFFIQLLFQINQLKKFLRKVKKSYKAYYESTPWLQDSISSINFDFLPHAIILEGVNGIGKKELGNLSPLRFLKTDTLNNHEQLVTQLTHPDLMKITDESIIKVDSIHSGIRFLNLKYCYFKK